MKVAGHLTLSARLRILMARMTQGHSGIVMPAGTAGFTMSRRTSLILREKEESMPARCGFGWTEKTYIGSREVPGIRHRCWLPDDHENMVPPVEHVCDDCGEEYDKDKEYGG